MAIEVLDSAFNDANCKRLGMEVVRLMFPEHDDEQAIAIGKSVCEGCICFEACDEIGMTKELHSDGIYAAKTRQERENLHRKVVREKRRGR